MILVKATKQTFVYLSNGYFVKRRSELFKRKEGFWRLNREEIKHMTGQKNLSKNRKF